MVAILFKICHRFAACPYTLSTKPLLISFAPNGIQMQRLRRNFKISILCLGLMFYPVIRTYYLGTFETFALTLVYWFAVASLIASVFVSLLFPRDLCQAVNGMLVFFPLFQSKTLDYFV